MSKPSISKQEQIDKQTAHFRNELDSVIVNTIEYQHGGFRFRIWEDCRGVYNFMVANTNWYHKFGGKFKEVAYRHGWTLKFDQAKGIYYMKKLKNDGKNRNDRGEVVETILERT